MYVWQPASDVSFFLSFFLVASLSRLWLPWIFIPTEHVEQQLNCWLH